MLYRVPTYPRRGDVMPSEKDLQRLLHADLARRAAQVVEDVVSLLREVGSVLEPRPGCSSVDVLPADDADIRVALKRAQDQIDRVGAMWETMMEIKFGSALAASSILPDGTGSDMADTAGAEVST